ncbi:Uncharacterised protein [Mycobacteroides abscessus subsp. abscessus]|uniref:hypothetical protein n=1 Tax=Mycobacteroides abscessus TaxID=36809 RepID=UPI0009278CDF|nr:hypothetical protein [Mycobacteroides abscessus]SIC20429.1 Uncharacterised protein [Mycobacteroides abscessus subsp. abscessus]
MKFLPAHPSRTRLIEDLIAYAETPGNWFWPIHVEHVAHVVTDHQPRRTWRQLIGELRETIELAERIIAAAEKLQPEARPIVGKCIPLPPKFVAAFIAEAESHNPEQDEYPLDIGLQDEKTIRLSNDCPGFSPVLRVIRDKQGRHTVLVGHNGGKKIPEVQASADVDLNNPVAAAHTAIECWHHTL